MELWKNATTTMNTVLNEACIRWIHENCYLKRGIILVRKISNFFAVRWDSVPIGRVWRKEQDKPYLVGATTKIKGGGIFGKLGNIWGIIPGGNPAWHCFVLRDLFSMNFFISHDYESKNVHHRQNFWLNLSKNY